MPSCTNKHSGESGGLSVILDMHRLQRMRDRIAATIRHNHDLADLPVIQK